MAEPNLAAAVSSIIIAYQTSRDLLHSIRLFENHWRQNSEAATKQKLLLDALLIGENQVADRYATIYGEVGEQFRIADSQAQNKLLRVAQLIDAKITKQLQIAVKLCTSRLDYDRITQDALIFRRAALGVLEEQRLVFVNALATVEEIAEPSTHPALQEEADDESRVQQAGSSGDKGCGVGEHRHDEIAPLPVEPGPVPDIQVADPHASDEQPQPSMSRLTRLFTKRKQPGNGKSPAAGDLPGADLHSLPRLERSPEKSWYASDDESSALDLTAARAYRETTAVVAWDKWIAQRPATADGALPRRPSTAPKSEPMKREASESTCHSSNGITRSSSNGSATAPTSPDSDTSSAKWAMSPKSDESSSDELPDLPELQSEEPPPIPLRSPLRSFAPHRRTLTASTFVSPSPNSFDISNLVHKRSLTAPTVESSALSSIRSATSRPSYQRSLTAATYDSSYFSRPTSASAISTPSITSAPTFTSSPTSIPSYLPSVTSALSRTPSFTPTPSLYSALSRSNTLVGRPSKKNNYWGFCKGAWTTRESPSTGLKVQTRPNGVYNTLSAWHCRQCSFRSEVLTKQAFAASFPDKDLTADAKVYATAGLMYRWVFLAKSHVKCKSAQAEGGQYSYGCLFCCVAGKPTSVYGDVETLMRHISADHVEELSRPDVQQRTKCVFGRVAPTCEDFDICVPAAGQREPSAFSAHGESKFRYV